MKLKKILPAIYVRLLRLFNFGKKSYTPYVLIGTYRTGSNLLVYSIKNHPEIVSFSEIFLPNKIYWGDSIYGYFPCQTESLILERERDVEKFTEKRVFKKYPSKIKAVGFKVFYQHLLKDGSSLPIMDWLEKHKEVKVIHITRKNLLDHYMSQEVVSKTGITVDVIDTVKNKEIDFQVEINHENLMSHFKYVENNVNWFHEKLSNHSKLEITYESLVTDFEIVQNQIFDFIGVKPRIVKMATKKLNTKKHSERISNWDDLKEKFIKTEYEWMFKD